VTHHLRKFSRDKPCTCDGFYETFLCRLVDTLEISGNVSTIIIDAIIHRNEKPVRYRYELFNSIVLINYPFMYPTINI
jgi:hypothetical protein